MIRIIALTPAGERLGKRVQSEWPGSVLWFKPTPFADTVQEAFRAGDSLLFICATGIVMRTLAPVLASKYSDPPVVVIDERGQFVIPLLSGHEGGANEWGRSIASLLNAQLVLTTANAYCRPIYTAGMGCERGCPKEALQTLLMDSVAQAQLPLTAITTLASIDIKADEVGLIELGQALNIPFKTWDRHRLSDVEAQLSVKSDYVFQTVGVYGVAESAALVAATAITGTAAELVLTKQKSAKATCAIARSYVEL